MFLYITVCVLNNTNAYLAVYQERPGKGKQITIPRALSIKPKRSKIIVGKQKGREISGNYFRNISVPFDHFPSQSFARWVPCHFDWATHPTWSFLCLNMWQFETKPFHFTKKIQETRTGLVFVKSPNLSGTCQ